MRQKAVQIVPHRKASRGTARDAGWHRDKMERCANTTRQRNMEKRALLNDGGEEVEKWKLASCPECVCMRCDTFGVGDEGESLQGKG